jgi:hypothetical protein
MSLKENLDYIAARTCRDHKKFECYPCLERDRDEQTDLALRTHKSNLALKAENEALKKDAQSDDEMYSKAMDHVEDLQASLSLYTSWQPSDPGTKEAMEWCDEVEPDEVGDIQAYGPTLAHALRAAMVRLEEAGKKGAYDWKAKALELAHLLGDIQEGVSSDGVLAWSEVEMKAWHKAVGQAMEIKS